MKGKMQQLLAELYLLNTASHLFILAWRKKGFRFAIKNIIPMMKLIRKKRKMSGVMRTQQLKGNWRGNSDT